MPGKNKLFTTELFWNPTYAIDLDIRAQIIDAVYSRPSTDHVEQVTQRQRLLSRAYPPCNEFKSFYDSADENTNTSLSKSDNCRTVERMTLSIPQSLVVEKSTDRVEGFKDREYPQLKGKTYLDHGGTTVRSVIQAAMMHIVTQN